MRISRQSDNLFNPFEQSWPCSNCGKPIGPISYQEPHPSDRTGHIKRAIEYTLEQTKGCAHPEEVKALYQPYMQAIQGFEAHMSPYISSKRASFAEFGPCINCGHDEVDLDNYGERPYKSCPSCGVTWYREDDRGRTHNWPEFSFPETKEFTPNSPTPSDVSRVEPYSQKYPDRGRGEKMGPLHSTPPENPGIAKFNSWDDTVELMKNNGWEYDRFETSFFKTIGDRHHVIVKQPGGWIHNSGPAGKFDEEYGDPEMDGTPEWFDDIRDALLKVHKIPNQKIRAASPSDRRVHETPADTIGEGWFSLNPEMMDPKAGPGPKGLHGLSSGTTGERYVAAVRGEDLTHSDVFDEDYDRLIDDGWITFAKRKAIKGVPYQGWGRVYEKTQEGPNFQRMIHRIFVPKKSGEPYRYSMKIEGTQERQAVPEREYSSLDEAMSKHRAVWGRVEEQVRKTSANLVPTSYRDDEFGLQGVRDIELNPPPPSNDAISVVVQPMFTMKHDIEQSGNWDQIPPEELFQDLHKDRCEECWLAEGHQYGTTQEDHERKPDWFDHSFKPFQRGVNERYMAKVGTQPGLWGDEPERPTQQAWEQPVEPEPEPQESTFRHDHWNRSTLAEDYSMDHDDEAENEEWLRNHYEDPHNLDAEDRYHALQDKYYENYDDTNWEEELDENPVRHPSDGRDDHWCYTCGRKNPRSGHTNLNTGEECSEDIVSNTRPEESWLRNMYRNNMKKERERQKEPWTRYDDLQAADDAWSEIDEHLQSQQHMKRHPEEESPGLGYNFYHKWDPRYHHGPRAHWPEHQPWNTQSVPRGYVGPQSMDSVDHEPGTRVPLGEGGFDEFLDNMGANTDPELGPDASRSRPPKISALYPTVRDLDDYGLQTFYDTDFSPRGHGSTFQPMFDIKHDYPGGAGGGGEYLPSHPDSCETCWLESGKKHVTKDEHRRIGHRFKPFKMKPNERFSALYPSPNSQYLEPYGLKSFYDDDFPAGSPEDTFYQMQPMIEIKNDPELGEDDGPSGEQTPNLDTCETCYLEEDDPYITRQRHEEGFDQYHPFKPFRVEPNERFSSLYIPGEDIGGGYNPERLPLCETCYLKDDDYLGQQIHEEYDLGHPFKPFKMEPNERFSSKGRKGVHAPYKIEPRGGKWVVVNDLGEVKGTHDTQGEARSHQKALYANVPGASEMAERKHSSSKVSEALYKSLNKVAMEPMECDGCGEIVNSQGLRAHWRRGHHVSGPYHKECFDWAEREV